MLYDTFTISSRKVLKEGLNKLERDIIKTPLFDKSKKVPGNLDALPLSEKIRAILPDIERRLCRISCERELGIMMSWALGAYRGIMYFLQNLPTRFSFDYMDKTLQENILRIRILHRANDTDMLWQVNVCKQMTICSPNFDEQQFVFEKKLQKCFDMFATMTPCFVHEHEVEYAMAYCIGYFYALCNMAQFCRERDGMLVERDFPACEETLSSVEASMAELNDFYSRIHNGCMSC